MERRIVHVEIRNGKVKYIFKKIEKIFHKEMD